MSVKSKKVNKMNKSSVKNAILSIGVLLCANILLGEVKPCRDIKFEPTAMRFGDIAQRGKPFSKDPTVIRHEGRYLMYYSVRSYDEAYLPKGMPKRRLKTWCGSVAESKDLVNWKRIGDINVKAATELAEIGVAPCVKKLDGKIHMFCQGHRPGFKNVLWHATSEDGINFVCKDSEPTFAPDNNWARKRRAIDAEVYRLDDKLIMMYAVRETTGKIQMLGMASAPYGSSYDLGTWTEITTEKSFFKPDLPWEMKCIEAPTVIKHKGVWYMFYAGAYNHERQQIGLAWSTDGINYKRWSEKPVFPHGEKGSWNEWESGHPGVFQDDDGQVYLFFQGKPTLKGDYLLSCAKVKFID